MDHPPESLDDCSLEAPLAAVTVESLCPVAVGIGYRVRFAKRRSVLALPPTTGTARQLDAAPAIGLAHRIEYTSVVGAAY